MVLFRIVIILAREDDVTNQEREQWPTSLVIDILLVGLVALVRTGS